VRDVADGMMRLAAAAAVIALGARTEAACSGRGLAEGHGFAVKGGAGVVGWCGDVTSGCGGLLISERQWGRSEATVAQSDTAVGRPKKRRCLLMVRPYVMSGAPNGRGFWIQLVRMRQIQNRPVATECSLENKHWGVTLITTLCTDSRDPFPFLVLASLIYYISVASYKSAERTLGSELHHHTLYR